MSRQRVKKDIVIFGGGIAGLWLLNRLSDTPYSAMLLETAHLGSGQTLASQGIIHGGTKYALTGKLTHSSQAITDMPSRWQQALSGAGEVDLSGLAPLSANQYLFSTQSLASKMTGFFASKVMSSKMEKVVANDQPALFQSQNFKGTVYQLNEPVLDTQQVLARLQAKAQENALNCYQLPSDYEVSQHQGYTLICSGELEIQAQVVVLTAGEGNEELLRQLGCDAPKMQRRPLHMPMLKSSRLPLIFAHALGASALPKMTITSAILNTATEQQPTYKQPAHQPTVQKQSTQQPVQQQETVWYLGGEIAEQGIERDKLMQIEVAKQELATLLPWCDVSDASWSSLTINRAEPLMADGSRPSESFVHSEDNIITAWPVKLAMSPLMSDKVLCALDELTITPYEAATSNTEIPLALAQVGDYPWQQCQWYNQK